MERSIPITSSKTRLRQHLNVVIKTENERHPEVEGRSRTCTVCFKVLAQSLLSRHMLLHKEKSRCCPKCDLKFRRQRDIRNHLANHDNFKFQCTAVECKMKFANSLHLSEHRMRTGHGIKIEPSALIPIVKIEESDQNVSKRVRKRKYFPARFNITCRPGERVFRCKLCDHSFAWYQSLAYHIRRHKYFRFKCSCGMAFSSRVKRKAHSLRSGHAECNDDLKCPKCNLANFKCPNDLQRHLERHKNFKLVCVESCGMSFSRRQAYLEHLKQTGHEGRVNFFTGPASECPKCDMKFRSEEGFRYHLKRHDFFKLECEVCGMRFSMLRYLNYHRDRSGHGKRSSKRFHCTKCDRTFASLRGFNYHVEHHDSFKFICTDSCGIKFSRLRFLRTHQRRTGHGTPFKTFTSCRGKCPVCGVNFERSVDFYCHLRKHDDFFYLCVECGIKFEFKRSLQRHQRVTGHENSSEQVNSFHCPKCDMTFLWQLQFEQHLARHEDFRHLCDVCGMKLPQKRHLIEHQKRSGHCEVVGSDSYKVRRMRTRSQSSGLEGDAEDLEGNCTVGRSERKRRSRVSIDDDIRDSYRIVTSKTFKFNESLQVYELSDSDSGEVVNVYFDSGKNDKSQDSPLETSKSVEGLEIHELSDSDSDEALSVYCKNRKVDRSHENHQALQSKAFRSVNNSQIDEQTLLDSCNNSNIDKINQNHQEMQSNTFRSDQDSPIDKTNRNQHDSSAKALKSNEHSQIDRLNLLNSKKNNESSQTQHDSSAKTSEFDEILQTCDLSDSGSDEATKSPVKSPDFNRTDVNHQNVSPKVFTFDENSQIDELILSEIDGTLKVINESHKGDEIDQMCELTTLNNERSPKDTNSDRNNREHSVEVVSIDEDIEIIEISDSDSDTVKLDSGTSDDETNLCELKVKGIEGISMKTLKLELIDCLSENFKSSHEKNNEKSADDCENSVGKFSSIMSCKLPSDASSSHDKNSQECTQKTIENRVSSMAVESSFENHHKAINLELLDNLLNSIEIPRRKDTENDNEKAAENVRLTTERGSLHNIEIENLQNSSKFDENLQFEAFRDCVGNSSTMIDEMPTVRQSEPSKSPKIIGNQMNVENSLPAVNDSLTPTINFINSSRNQPQIHQTSLDYNRSQNHSFPPSTNVQSTPINTVRENNINPVSQPPSAQLTCPNCLKSFQLHEKTIRIMACRENIKIKCFNCGCEMRLTITAFLADSKPPSYPVEGKMRRITDYFKKTEPREIVKRRMTDGAAKSMQYGCGECNLDFEDNNLLWEHLNEKHFSQQTQ